MNHEHDNNRAERSQTLRAVKSHDKITDPLALMDCGQFSLLISSKDIVTLMSAHKMIASAVEHTCGMVEFEQQLIPVFAFNKALQLQTSVANKHMTLVIFHHDSHTFAVCCSALEKVDPLALDFFPVPVSMSSRKQPFTQFAVVNKRAAGLSSAAELWQLLTLRNAVPTATKKTKGYLQGVR